MPIGTEVWAPDRHNNGKSWPALEMTTTSGSKVIANLLVVTETKRRPALMLGTSTDPIGTPSGQSFYAMFSKNLKRETGLPISPYIGAAYGTFDDRLRPVGGWNVFLHEKVSLLVTYYGVNVHPLLTFSHRRHALSLVMVKGRDPGMSYSIAF